MLARIACLCCVGLLVGLAAVSCTRSGPVQPAATGCRDGAPCPAGQRCGADGRCEPAAPRADAAVSGDAALSESRVPDAGTATPDAALAPGYRVTGTLGGLPQAAGPSYQLHEQRLDLLQPRCARVADETLCVSGSLH